MAGKVSDGVTDRALKIVDQIVKGMPEKEKEGIIDAIVSDKNSRDHFLKIVLWTYCSKDIMKDLRKKENIRKVINKWDRKKHISEQKTKSA